MSFSVTWDTAFDILPADDGLISVGAARIRNLKSAIVERMQVDHEFATSGGGTDTGYHKRVTLKKVAGGPSEAIAGYAEVGYNSTDATLEVYPEGGSKKVLVETALAQTLTNKTLNSPTLNSPAINSATLLTSSIDGVKFKYLTGSLTSSSYPGTQDVTHGLGTAEVLVVGICKPTTYSYWLPITDSSQGLAWYAISTTAVRLTVLVDLGTYTELEYKLLLIYS